MSKRLTPVTRRELVKKFKRLGWEGPFPGGDHAYMKKQSHKIPIPKNQEIDTSLLRRILREADISREEWFATG